MTHLKNISTYISRITISIAVLLMAPQFAIAQNKKLQDGKRLMVQKNDTTALFMGFSVSADIVGPAMLLFGDYGQYEGALRINLKDKYFPIIELGYGKCDHIEERTNIRATVCTPVRDMPSLHIRMIFRYQNFKILSGVILLIINTQETNATI